MMMTIIITTAALYKIQNNDMGGESRSQDRGKKFVQNFGGKEMKGNIN
jgi:hypothetical protein